MSRYNKDLITFLNDSPTPFHAVETMSRILLEHGFAHLREENAWQLRPGKYFVTRN